jgi:hypothetical protein
MKKWKEKHEPLFVVLKHRRLFKQQIFYGVRNLKGISIVKYNRNNGSFL